MSVAKTILEQFGGARAMVMIGGKDLVASDYSLTFKFGRGAKNKANRCRITLEMDDTYTITFFKIVKMEVKIIEEIEGVYFDQLMDIFEDRTGMFLTLNPRKAA